MITFSDSRQGTARFAGRAQLEAERNYVRSFLYHTLWSRASSSGTSALAKQRVKVEQLQHAIEAGADWAVGDRSAKELTRRNSMTSPYLWLLCMLAAIPSVLFWNNTAVLSALIVLFGVSYVALYWRIVRFKSPRWLLFRR
jgi:hypothetical protein